MYDKHHLPHDAKQRDLSTGISRLEFFREMGITNVETIPVKPITYGIECVHRLFPKCTVKSMTRRIMSLRINLYIMNLVTGRTDSATLGKLLEKRLMPNLVL